MQVIATNVENMFQSDLAILKEHMANLNGESNV